MRTKILLKEMQCRVKKNINNKNKYKDAVKDGNIGNIIGFPAIVQTVQFLSYITNNCKPSSKWY